MIFSLRCVPVATVGLNSDMLITVPTVKHCFDCSLCLLLFMLRPYQQHISDTACFICSEADVRTRSQLLELQVIVPLS